MFPLRPILEKTNDKDLLSKDDRNLFRPTELPKGKEKKEELRSVVAIFRHGDRRPKQKMKMKVCTIYWLASVAIICIYI